MRKTNYKWIIAGCVINILFYFVMLWFFNSHVPFAAWYSEGGDTPDYVSYAQNLLADGIYTNGESYFSRMPAFPIVLALLLFIFKYKTAMMVLVVTQVLLSGLASFFMGRVCEMISGKRMGFYAGFFLAALFPLLHSWDYILLTESISYSLFAYLVFSITSKIRSGREFNTAWLIGNGTILLFLTGLRPFMILFYLLTVAIVFLVPVVKRNTFLSTKLRNAFLLLLPLLLFETWWIPRNYILSDGKIIPLQVNMYAGLDNKGEIKPEFEAYVAVWNWSNAVGEDFVLWRPESFGSYFFKAGPFPTDEFNFSERVICCGYTEEDIREAKTWYAIMDTASDRALKIAYADSVTTLFNTMTERYKEENWFNYHFINRLLIAKHVFLHSGPVLPLHPYPEIRNHLFELLVKVFSVISYAIVLVTGFVYTFIVIATFKKRSILENWIALYILVFTAFICFYLRTTEFRIYLLLFPALVFFTVKAWLTIIPVKGKSVTR